MNNILIFGGAGYIGNALVDCIKKSVKVTVFDNLKHEILYRRNDAKLINADICIESETEYAIDQIAEKSGTIVILAGIVGDWACSENYKECIDVNVKSVIHITNYINKMYPLLRVIYISSCSVYGKAEKQNKYFISETSPLQPLGIYAGSKVAAEHKILKLENHIILRLGTLYGLSDILYGRPRLDLCINAFIGQGIVSKKIVYFGGEQKRTFIHVKDAAKIIEDICCLKENKHVVGTFNASSWNSSINDIIIRISKIFNSYSINITVNELKNPEKFDERSYCTNPDKLMKNFKFIDFIPGNKQLSSVFDEIQQIVPRIQRNNINNGYFIN